MNFKNSFFLICFPLYPKVMPSMVPIKALIRMAMALAQLTAIMMAAPPASLVTLLLEHVPLERAAGGGTASVGPPI